MSIHLVPDKTIHFHGPFTLPVRRTLTITNENVAPVAFRVRTTSPKTFALRPNVGRIEPGDSIEVPITHFAIKKQPPFSPGFHEKFLVQSTFIRPSDAKDPQSMWKTLDATGDTRTIYSQKISVTYHSLLEDEENTGTDEISNPTAVSTSFTRSPSPSPPVAPPPSPQFDNSNRNEKPRQAPGSGIVNEDLKQPLPSTPVPIVRSNRNLEQQLSDAQEEIRHLRALLARSGDGAGSGTDADARTRTSTPKSLAAGVELMVEALKSFVHPLASSEPLDGAHS